MQLAAFSRAGEKLAAEDIKVVAASTDPEEQVKETIAHCEVNFPIGHSIDPVKVSEITGAFYQPDPPNRPRSFLHTTNFLLSPDGKVNIAVYSSGPLGRLVWQDVLQAVQYRKKMLAEAKKS